MSRIQKLDDLIRLKDELLKARGVNQMALELSIKAAELLNNNILEYDLDPFQTENTVKVIIRSGNESYTEMDDDSILISIKKHLSGDEKSKIIAHELNHAIELLGKSRFESTPKAEDKYRDVLKIMDFCEAREDEEDYKFMLLVYKAERTEIKAFIQQAYTEMFNGVDFTKTEAYEIAEDLKNIKAPQGKTINAACNWYKINFDIEKTIIRLKQISIDLFKKLEGLKELVDKEGYEIKNFKNPSKDVQTLKENLNIPIVKLKQFKIEFIRKSSI